MIACANCELSKYRHSIVEGRGLLPCDMLFIGEGPGVSEDVLGKAFIGPSGKLLDEMIKRAGVPQSTRIYMTNMVLCRPCDGKAAENREPKNEEILACNLNLDSIIWQANPIVVVLVGSVAKQYLGKRFKEAICIQHPSFLIRSGGTGSPYFAENVNKLRRAASCLVS